MAALYAVKFTLSDGDHIAKLVLPNRDDSLARFKADRIFKNVLPVELQYTDRQGYAQMVDAVKNKYPARVPIAERTGGIPNRVLHNPDLVNDESDGL